MIASHPTTTLAGPAAALSSPRPAEGVRVTGRRVGAYLVDWLLYALIAGWAFITFATHTTTDTITSSGIELRLDLGNDSYQLTGTSGLLFILGAFAFWCLTRATLHARFGRTPGKALTAITVTDTHGKRPTFSKALVRELTWPVDGFPYLIPCLVGYVTVLASNDRQRIGDRLASTRVTRNSIQRAD